MRHILYGRAPITDWTNSGYRAGYLRLVYALNSTIHKMAPEKTKTPSEKFASSVLSFAPLKRICAREGRVFVVKSFFYAK